MKKETYDDIINQLYKLTTLQEKREYLLSVIEAVDYDENGLNDELRKLYNKFKD